MLPDTKPLDTSIRWHDVKFSLLLTATSLLRMQEPSVLLPDAKPLDTSIRWHDVNPTYSLTATSLLRMQESSVLSLDINQPYKHLTNRRDYTFNK